MDTLESVNNLVFVAFDFETTGLSSERDAIVEFGAVKFKAGQILGSFQSLVDPGRSIPEDASRISGITDAMVRGQAKVQEVLPGFLDFIQGSVLVAHNAGFDLAFLRKACMDKGFDLPQNQVVDTQVLSRKAFPGQRSYSLQNLVAFLGLPPNQAHRAEDDAIMCMRLLLACVDKLSFMGDMQLGELLA